MAGAACLCQQTVAQIVEETDALKSGDDQHKTEQQRQHTVIDIFKVGDGRRYNKRRDDSEQPCGTEYSLFFDK